MINKLTYVLISTIIQTGDVSQSTATFADKASCENAAQREDVVLKSFQIQNAKWNLTCAPYEFNAGESK